MNKNYLKQLDENYPKYKKVLEEKLLNILKSENFSEVEIDSKRNCMTIQNKDKSHLVKYSINDFAVESDNESLTVAYNSFMAGVFGDRYIKDSTNHFNIRKICEKNQIKFIETVLAELDKTKEYKQIKNVLYQIEREANQTIRYLDTPDVIYFENKSVKHKKAAKPESAEKKSEIKTRKPHSPKEYTLDDFEEENQKIRDLDTPDPIYTENDNLSL